MTTRTKFQQTSREIVGEHEADFGLRDQSGRAIGYHVIYFRRTFQEAAQDATFYYTSDAPFEALTVATRDGMRFGASTRSITGSTLEDVQIGAEKRQEDARRRYAKKFEG